MGGASHSFIDCKTMVESLKIFVFFFHPLVQKAQEWFCIDNRCRSINFCWIAFHVGINDNEIADREAKDALSSALGN